MATENDKVILVCECNSTEHQIVIFHSDDEGSPISYLRVIRNYHLFLYLLLWQQNKVNFQNYQKNN